jgi:predicted RNA-binding protein (TIGR00451 family)
MFVFACSENKDLMLSFNVYWKTAEKKPMDAESLRKIRCVADYQFGKDVGARLFPETVTISYSKNTGKIRHIHLNDELLATLRPTTGLFTLTVAGAKRLISEVNPRRLWVKLEDYAEPFVAKGRSAFAKHVTDADPEIRPREEVVVINAENEVLAVGRALLSGTEMKAFNRGIAVRIRHGAEKS